MGTVSVVVVAVTADQHEWARAAARFAAKGTAVRIRCVERLADARGEELVVRFDGSDRAAGDVLVADASGRSFAGGAAAAEALLENRDHLQVCLTDRAGRGVVGRVGALRSVESTVAAGMAVLGPLLVQWAAGRREAVGEVGASGDAPSRSRADRRGALRFAGRLVRAAVTARNWQVARLPGDLASLHSRTVPPTRLRWEGPARRAFWADPCVVRAASQEWLFVEELRRASGMGVIRAARLIDGRLQPGDVVLQTAHHLSYPQIYRVGSRWLATVETCASHNPVYEFDDLGGPWREAADHPVLPPHIADPVLVFSADGQAKQLWGTDATANPDAVFVRFDHREGAWVRDDTAVYVDVLHARGGGRLDLGRGLRAVQDCAGTYGRAADLLDLGGASVCRVTPEDLPKAADRRRRQGVHTLTWWEHDEVVWCDGWLRRFTILGGFWRLRERRHSRTCQG